MGGGYAHVHMLRVFVVVTFHLRMASAALIWVFLKYQIRFDKKTYVTKERHIPRPTGPKKN